MNIFHRALCHLPSSRLIDKWLPNTDVNARALAVHRNPNARIVALNRIHTLTSSYILVGKFTCSADVALSITAFLFATDKHYKVRQACALHRYHLKHLSNDADKRVVEYMFNLGLDVTALWDMSCDESESFMWQVDVEKLHQFAFDVSGVDASLVSAQVTLI